MNVYSLLLYVVLIPSACVNSKTIYNDRYGNDKYKARLVNSDDDQPMILADEPQPVQYGSPPAQYMYQRVPAPYMYNEYYRPRQKFRYADERPYMKRGDFQKKIYINYDTPEKRQCRSLANKRRSISYAKQPYNGIPLREDPYYLSEANQIGRIERIERNDRNSMYMMNRDDEEESESSNDAALVGEPNPSAKYLDDKYPSVLANFKIGSKLDKKSIAEPNAMKKREYHQNDSTVAKASGTSSFEEIETDGKVAEELRDILDYMGLIDEDGSSPTAKMGDDKSSENVKEAYEDENMEEGNNKISLTKEEHKSRERSKREDKACSKTDPPELSSSTKVAEPSGTQLNVRIADSNSEQKSKREMTSSSKEDSSTAANSKSKASEFIPTVAETNEASEYEKRVERQIQNRINALKEEVKREIAALKAQEAAQAVHTLNDDPQRKKRQAVDTLLDEESSDLDPALHPDADLKPHIRKRRHADGEKEDQEIEGEDIASELVENPSKQVVNIDKKTTDAATTLSPAVLSENITSIRSSSVEEATVPPENHKRRKREAEYEVSFVPARHKRANRVLPGANLAFIPYRDVDAEDEEMGEMEYDGFYDIIPNIQRKRQANIINLNRRSNIDDNYQNARMRRDYEANEFNSFRGGGSAENQMSAIRARRMAGTKRVRRRAYDKKEQPQTLSDMSDSDIFGALPQGYDGELSRFKRVKRNRGKG